MSIKSWVLDRVHRMNGLVARADLPPREPMRGGSTPAPAADSTLTSADHLGPYGALIGAIREELEHFVVGHVRLHLAIADRDRFVLTSIGVRCPDDGQARDLLAQFMHEFKPEQVKRYLSREVIAGLPNASAIDLSQFAGLFDADAAEDAGEYRELLVALRGSAPAPAASAYQVSVLGRWSEIDPSLAAGAASSQFVNGATPATPLAGLRCEFEVEDGNGRRRVVLQSVVAGRRYMIGKGEGCDIRVAGAYTSRRHAEIWLDSGSWWVADAGSTNGIRVESTGGSVERCAATAQGAAGQAVRIADGARIVLSANAEGPPSDYPAVMLRPALAPASRVTPIAGAAPSPTTPLTPILARAADSALMLTARLATGERKLSLHAGALPLAVGRSRNQQLVIDRVHEAVSGHHLDIVDVDDAGVQVVVHGDNGVVVEGVPYPAGARFRWKVGDTMLLGPHGDSECTLTLSRAR
ncbi:FHA domain-containing protein [Piscinibacter sp. XHJ-5]|uniref:FHA domain-containing protein n=1 Tax=Piscinibacter sp. XHJ-5 TaxID=3037797 RepID=UPI0024536F7B|nr:FHA domain-containing protein [Piscinibacter sp. XHJ-5]